MKQYSIKRTRNLFGIGLLVGVLIIILVSTVILFIPSIQTKISNTIIDKSSKYQETVSNVNDLILEKEKAINELSDKIKDLLLTQTKLVKSSETISSLNTEISNLENEIEKLNTDISNNNSEILNLQSRIDELERLMATIIVKPTSAKYFTFNGNTVTGYTGTDTEIVVPKSYSMTKTFIDKKDFSDYDELHDYVMDLDSDSFPLTISYDDEEFVADSLMDIDRNYSLLSATKFAIVNYDTKYFDGNDYEVTTLGRHCFTYKRQLKKIIFLNNIVDFENGYGSPFYDVSAELVFPENFLNQATDLSYLFERYNGETLDVSNLNTSNATNMNNMFASATNVKLKTIIGLDKLDTSKVKDMSFMFCNLKSNTVDLSGFSIDSLENTHAMFLYSEISTFYVSENNSDWTNHKITNSSSMFDYEEYGDINGAKLIENGGHFTLKNS